MNKDKNMFSFYVVYKTGSKYVETGLTKRQAVMRYNAFGKSLYQDDVSRFGYVEVHAWKRRFIIEIFRWLATRGLVALLLIRKVELWIRMDRCFLKNFPTGKISLKTVIP